MSADSPVAIIFDESGQAIGTITDGYVNRLQVENKYAVSTNTTRSIVSSSISDTLLLSINIARINAILYNDSDSPAYIGLGSSIVSSNDYTFLLSSNSSTEIPLYFVGEVRAVWQVQGGVMRITEFT